MRQKRGSGSGGRGAGKAFPDPGSILPVPGPRSPDPEPQVTRAHILAALARRRERRAETVTEVASALAALAAAVEGHTRLVEEVRRAVEAQGGDVTPLQFYDSLMARFRSELRAAERTLADAFRAAAADAAAAG
ncbi:MAG TPA: hypothetical protein VMT77_01260 [Gemmatimonadales bacterium]|nr:hypothetical protein [Gemmatimonadales bacterium]